MRVLVTGADGFIGRHLVQALLNTGVEVVTLTRRLRKPRSKHVTNLTFNLLEPTSWEKVLSSVGAVDTIIHLAALMPYTPNSTGSDFIIANGAFTQVLSDWLNKKNTPSKFIYFSSIGVIGKPETLPVSESYLLRPRHPYFVGKLSGEFAVQTCNPRKITTLIFRLTSPYGPSMPANTVLPLFVELARGGKNLNWHGSGSRRQDFIYIDDIIHICLSSLDVNSSGIYCLGNGTPISMRNLAQMIAAKFSGTKASASGLTDPQEGISWVVDTSLLENNLNYMQKTLLFNGLEKYIKNLDQPTINWWEES